LCAVAAAQAAIAAAEMANVIVLILRPLELELSCYRNGMERTKALGTVEPDRDELIVPCHHRRLGGHGAIGQGNPEAEPRVLAHPITTTLPPKHILRNPPSRRPGCDSRTDADCSPRTPLRAAVAARADSAASRTMAR